MHPFGLQAVTPTRLVRHAPEAPGLLWLGLGPGFRHNRALLKLQRLFNRHANWAQSNFTQLRRLLEGSGVMVSLWGGQCLAAFRRATSDGCSRAVLWDIVVAGDLQGRGLGRIVVGELLHTQPDAGVKRMHLVTANSAGFYRQLGFRDADPQQLLVLKR